jgi:UPF0755 protein
VPLNPDLFALYARLSGEGGRIKAGSYEIKPGYTPQRLLLQLVRGEFAQEALTVIEAGLSSRCAVPSPTSQR